MAGQVIASAAVIAATMLVVVRAETTAPVQLVDGRRSVLHVGQTATARAPSNVQTLGSPELP